MRTPVLWFTGLSGSGKTTIANELAKKLEQEGKTVKILDGDVIRNSIHQHLGFTPEDINKNNELIAELCLEYEDCCDFILVAIISPFIESRKRVREIIGQGFIEVYVEVSLEEAIKRDIKGLYKKAFSGEIENFIGVEPNVPYQPPQEPEIHLDTQKLTVDDSARLVCEYMAEKGFIERD